MADTFIENVLTFGHYNDTDVIYAVVRNIADKKVRDVENGAWDVWPGDSLADYDISIAAASGGLWVGDFPEITAGFYIVQYRIRAGDTPAVTDTLIASEKGYWNGSIFASVDLDSYGRVDLGKWKGAIPADLAATYLQTDVRRISGDSTAASNLSKGALSILQGTVDATVTPTTTVFEAADITEATADHFIGRIVIFTSGILQYQATDITDYFLHNGRGQFTVTALTEPPGDTDTFIIV